MSTVPGGPKAAMRRRANQERKASSNDRANSTRGAGAGGSSNTLLKLYTEESPGLSMDPVVVLVAALVFVFAVVSMHVIGKISTKLSA